MFLILWWRGFLKNKLLGPGLFFCSLCFAASFFSVFGLFVALGFALGL